MTIRRGLIFANPERSSFCQSGGFYFVKINKLKGIRFLRNRIGTSDCTGNLPFIKRSHQNKTAVNSDIRENKPKLKKKRGYLIGLDSNPNRF